jgi:hypothetical protein
MRVGVLSPTTSQLVEKMAALFPEGVELVGPQADDRHYWNNCHLRLQSWNELGLKVLINEVPFDKIDFRDYDLLIESVETFQYSNDWARHCLKVECPILLKACWTNHPRVLLPVAYIKKIRKFPVLLEMPAHIPNWTATGFTDVNFIPNPVGDWWFEREWTGQKQHVLFVLSGRNSWRPDDLSANGVDWWDRLCEKFPSKTYHHDGHVSYRTPRQMAELFAESRVFVNFDRPYGPGERPLTLAFTEALSAGLPVAARDMPGLSYRRFIDSNGICSKSFEEIQTFLARCLDDIEYASSCSKRSRKIGMEEFSSASLRPRYWEIISRSQNVFSEVERSRKRSFAFFNRILPARLRF